MRIWFTLTIILFAWTWATPLTTLYNQVYGKLEHSKQVLSTNPTESLRLVETALQSFRSGTTNMPSALVDGITQALSEARISIVRQSPGDLEARLWIVRGAFGKALYDQFFRAVSTGNSTGAEALLSSLAQATGRSPAFTAKAEPLMRTKNLEALRLLIERSYALAMIKTLGLAEKAKTTVSAYALTSKAYGLFLLVQDSPRIGKLNARAFVNTLTQLTQGSEIGFKTGLETLLNDTQGFYTATHDSIPNTQATPQNLPSQ